MTFCIDWDLGKAVCFVDPRLSMFPSASQYVLCTLDCRCFPRLRLGKHRQSRVHKTYCFPPSQSISANFTSLSTKVNLDYTSSVKNGRKSNEQFVYILHKEPYYALQLFYCSLWLANCMQTNALSRNLQITQLCASR